MTKKIKKLSALTIAVLAGLLVSFTSVDVMASDFTDINNETIVSVHGYSATSIIIVGDIDTDNKCGEGKCGEGKCGTATKESKPKTEKKELSVKKEGEVTTEKKCGEGKCGGAEKKESKEKKEGAKKEAKEGKCGEGKCGLA